MPEAAPALSTPSTAAHHELLAAARPLVALTFAEANEKLHHGHRFMFCRCDVLNPCWEPSYSPSGWGEYGAGKHWGGRDACPECKLRAAIFKSTGGATCMPRWRNLAAPFPASRQPTSKPLSCSATWAASFVAPARRLKSSDSMAA